MLKFRKDTKLMLGQEMITVIYSVLFKKTKQNTTQLSTCTGEGNGNPLQYSCLENPRDGGAWWAAVYGVTQSRHD